MGEKRNEGGVASQSDYKLIKAACGLDINQKHVYPLKELVNGDCQPLP